MAPGRLPRRRGRFVGRERERGEIRARLARHRWVTLTGPGGIGKSALAIRLARDLAPDYADGAYFVDLSSLDRGRQLPGRVLRELDGSVEGGLLMEETMLAQLERRELLLVLDNAEHVLDAYERIAARILERCPEVDVLGTSRAAPRGAAAAAFAVPPLAVPPEDAQTQGRRARYYDALRLFAGLAAARGVNGVLQGENVAVAARLCRRLEGFPLAIELAAAGLSDLSLADLEAKLESHMARGVRDGAGARPDHASMAATIDWSERRLDPPSTALLRRLSVLRGGWTQASAEEVCVGAPVSRRDVAGLLDVLRDRSLIWQEDPGMARVHGQPRFQMYETIREHLAARLDEDGDTELRRSLHFAHFAAMAREGRPALYGRVAEPDAWLARFDAEEANLRAAARWAMQGGSVEGGLELLSTLVRYWEMNARLEDGGRFADGLVQDVDLPLQPAQRARLLGIAGRLLGRYVDRPRSRELFREQCEIYTALDDQAGLIGSYNGLGQLAAEPEDKLEYFRKALEILRDRDEPARTASLLINMTSVHGNADQLDRALPLIREAVEIYRGLPEMRIGLMVSLCLLGNTEMATGDLGSAEAHLAESLEIGRELRDAMTLPMIHHVQGRLFLAQGRTDLAREQILLALDGHRTLQHGGEVARDLQSLAEAERQLDRSAHAIRLLGHAERIREDHGVTLTKSFARREKETREALRTAVSPEDFASAWELGRRRDLDELLQRDASAE